MIVPSALNKLPLLCIELAKNVHVNNQLVWHPVE